MGGVLGAALLAEKQDAAAREIADSLRCQETQDGREDLADLVEAGADSPGPESDRRLA